MNQTEAERLAGAIAALRPDWPARSLLTFITRSLVDRAYRDATIAFVWVATDPTTDSPGRVLEHGPWWRAAQGVFGARDPEPDAIPDRNTCPFHRIPKPCRACADHANEVNRAHSAGYIAQARQAILDARPNHTDEQETR